jgi:hypothetical protein
MRVQVSQNSRSRWVAMLQGEWGNTESVSDEFPTREQAVEWAETAWPDVAIVSDGVSLGADAPPAPLPKVDPAAELLGPNRGQVQIGGPA